MDYINFVVVCYNQGMNFNNVLLFEIKVFYFNEYCVVMKVWDMINEEFNILLFEDEVGFIVFYIVNVELGFEMEEIMKIMQFIYKVLNII